MKSTLFEKLAHYWPMDSAVGTKRSDNVDTDSYFQEIGGPVPSSTDGMRNGSALGPNNGAIYLSTLSAAVSQESPSTLSFWIKYDIDPPTSEFIFYQPNTGSEQYFYVESSGGVCWLGDTASGDFPIPLAILIGSWNLVVIVREEESWRVSINGSAFVSASLTATLETVDMRIMGCALSAFTGKMCEMGVWSCALTQEEVNRMWNDGDGLFPDEFTTEIDRRIKLPNTGVVLLADIEFGIGFTNWIADGTYNENGIHKTPCAHEIIEVKWNNVPLTKVDNQLYAENLPGSWHWDGAYLWVTPPVDPTTGASRIALGKWFWWRQPKTLDIFSTMVVAIGLIRTSTVPRELNDTFYDPRLIAAPNLSLRIPHKFADIAQTGSGTFKFVNVDGFFNELDRFSLAAGRIVVRLGIDKFDSEMEWEDYEVIATWDIESWFRTDADFSIKVVEPKNKLKTKLPYQFFNLTDYPRIEPSWIGKAVPLAYGPVYGVEAIPIDVGLKKFKVAERAKDLSSVRLGASNTQKNQRNIDGPSWQFYSGDAYRYYQPSEETTNVKFNGASLNKANSVSDCISTKGTWAFDENFTYVNPKVGFTIFTGTYTIESELVVLAWVQTNFATKDTANGEFTLGQDWGPGIQVSVDFIGDPDITNAVDVIMDLVRRSGQTNVNEASFDDARASIFAGTDEGGNDVFLFPIGVYIPEPKPVEDLVSNILRVIRGYWFTDALGAVNVGIFEPEPGDGLLKLSFQNILDFQSETEKIDSTAITVKYKPRRIERWTETLSGSSQEIQNLNKQAQPVIFLDEENPLADTESVQFFVARFLAFDAIQLKIYRVLVAWEAMRLLPGDQILLDAFDELGSSLVAEVLEKNLDVSNKKLQLVLGEQRGLYDSSGFWVDDQARLPEEFSDLAGYVDGSLFWNDDWDPIIKRWAKQNVGYWCDDNGFVSSTDPESQLTSTWV